MTLQELNDYIQDIIADPELQETCRFSLGENTGEWIQSIGRQEDDLVSEGVYYDKDGVIIVALDGGLNGSGDWKDYFNGLIAVLNAIEELPEVEFAYLVDIINDCPDDVFYSRIAVKPASDDSFEE
ncbi:MAG: hypothetical protein J5725_06325 [Bacteroidales bacterium]|nr:hypothetical protein [Bacteroidales bacterium]